MLVSVLLSWLPPNSTSEWIFNGLLTSIWSPPTAIVELALTSPVAFPSIANPPIVIWFCILFITPPLRLIATPPSPTIVVRFSTCAFVGRSTAYPPTTDLQFILYLYLLLSSITLSSVSEFMSMLRFWPSCVFVILSDWALSVFWCL